MSNSKMAPKKKIAIFAHFCGDFDTKTNNRFNYLAEMFSNLSYEVTLVTSSFSHTKKMQRQIINSSDNIYEIIMIKEPGYKKNISLRRFHSHYVMSRNFKKIQKSFKEFDSIICAIPSLYFAFLVTKIAKKYSIPLTVDVQDLWPEAFQLSFNIPIISNIIYFPFKYLANYVYRNADNLVAVSETYLKRALELNPYANSSMIYLGTSVSNFDNILTKCKFEDKNDGFWIGYVGTLGHSYSIKSIIDGIDKTAIEIKNKTTLVLLGDGPLQKEFKDYAFSKGVKCRFEGRLPYDQMICKLSNCDIVVNPIHDKAAQSITNKHADYLVSGKPILNTQQNPEFRNLIDKFDLGTNCSNNSPKEIANIIEIYFKEEKQRDFHGSNARKFGEKYMNRDMTYKAFVDLIEFDKVI